MHAGHTQGGAVAKAAAKTATHPAAVLRAPPLLLSLAMVALLLLLSPGG